MNQQVEFEMFGKRASGFKEICTLDFFFFLILADSPGRFTGPLVRKGDSFKTFSRSLRSYKREF